MLLYIVPMDRFSIQKVYKLEFVDKDYSLWNYLKSLSKLQMRCNEGRNSGYGEGMWIGYLRGN